MSVVGLALFYRLNVKKRILSISILVALWRYLILLQQIATVGYLKNKKVFCPLTDINKR